MLKDIYCLKCRKHTGNVEPVGWQAPNKRWFVKCKCATCGTKKNKTATEEEIQRLKKGGFIGAILGPLISGLAGPLLGGLFGQKSGAGRKKKGQ